MKDKILIVLSWLKAMSICLPLKNDASSDSQKASRFQSITALESITEYYSTTEYYTVTEYYSIFERATLADILLGY